MTIKFAIALMVLFWLGIGLLLLRKKLSSSRLVPQLATPLITRNLIDEILRDSVQPAFVEEIDIDFTDEELALMEKVEQLNHLTDMGDIEQIEDQIESDSSVLDLDSLNATDDFLV